MSTSTRHRAPSRRRTWLPAALVTIVTLLALALRLHDIGAKSLWVDESFTLWIASQPVEALLSATLRTDQHPPLYYLLLHPFVTADSSEAALRVFSASWGVATVPVMYGIGRLVGAACRLNPVVLGLVVALLQAVSPLHVGFGQQGRMYTMLPFFAAVAMLCLLRMLRTGATMETGDIVAWAGFIVALPLTMLSHNTAVLFGATVAAYVVVLAVLRRRAAAAAADRFARDPDGTIRLPAGLPGAATAPAVRHWVLALVVAMFLWLPWLPGFLLQSRRVDADFWIPPPSWNKVLEHLRDLASAWSPAPLLVPIVLVAGALVAYGAWTLRRRPEVLGLLLMMLLFPLVGELLISIRRPIFYSQTLIWTSLPFTVLLAVGLLRLPWRRWAAVAVAAVLALNLFSLSSYYGAAGIEDWSGAAGFVAERAAPGDLVLFDAGWTQLAFRYYYDRTAGASIDPRGLPVEPFERGALEPRMTVSDVPYLDALVAGRQRVWLVLSHDWYTDPDRIVTSRLGQSMDVTEQRDLAGMRVQEYRPR
ncbi:glycosyltransferase family 39 protein [Pseudonocardia sp. GCM10023141]|uniref:glycosyltransferase family 39 protein n=1 Tax=Pseudonocardia sp. GCM10023141 TaxID=3252653 RepID=UPI0036145304